MPCGTNTPYQLRFSGQTISRGGFKLNCANCRSGTTSLGFQRNNPHWNGLNNTMFVCAYQFHFIAGLFQCIHGDGMWYIHNADVVHLQNWVVHLQAAVGGGGAAGYQLRDVDGCIVTNVRIVSAACNTEAQTGAAALQLDLFILPFVIAINLNQKIWYKTHITLQVSLECLRRNNVTFQDP